MPLLGQQPDVAEFCSSYAASLPGKPTAIVVVTAHWEEQVTTVCSAGSPSLYFDYYGFPPESYQYTYPAPGSPELAEHIQSLLREAGLAVTADSQRGWDHGVFVPLMLMFPDADVPVVAVSVLANQDAGQHIAVGEALCSLRDQGVLLIGSGYEFHNFKYLKPILFSGGDERLRKQGIQHSHDFDSFLRQTITGAAAYASRKEVLTQWEQTPAASEAQPPGGAEHLMPLFAMFGAGGQDGKAKVRPEKQLTSELAVSAFEFW